MLAGVRVDRPEHLVEVVVVDGFVDEPSARAVDHDRARQGELDVRHPARRVPVVDVRRVLEHRDAPHRPHGRHGSAGGEAQLQPVAGVARCADRGDGVGQERLLQARVPLEAAGGEHDGTGGDGAGGAGERPAVGRPLQVLDAEPGHDPHPALLCRGDERGDQGPAHRAGALGVAAGDEVGVDPGGRHRVPLGHGDGREVRRRPDPRGQPGVLGAVERAGGPAPGRGPHRATRCGSRAGGGRRAAPASRRRANARPPGRW